MTPVEICNGALQKIGEARITSMTEDSKGARACNAVYDKIRKIVLRMYPWGFATKRVITSPVSEEPAFEYTYAHALPSDFLRVVELFEYDDAYRVEGRYLLCYSDAISLRYVYDIKDLTGADPLFTETLEWLIAHNISRYMTESDTIRQEASENFRKLFSYAKFVQSTDHSQRELEAYDLAESRLLGGFVRDPMTH